MKKIYLYSDEMYEKLSRDYPDLTKQDIELISNFSDFKSSTELQKVDPDGTQWYRDEWYISVPEKIADYYNVSERIFIVPFQNGMLFKRGEKT